MKDGQANDNIPVLTDVVSLGPLVTADMVSSDKAPAVPTPEAAPTGDSTKQHTIDTQTRLLVEKALPIIMPELEKLTRKTLLELIRKLQKHGITS